MSDDARVVDTVGSLLAIIATSTQNALRCLMFADKRAWASPEFQQLRLLEETLDEAKRDFQELPVFTIGRSYYENDRKAESLDELHELCTRFEEHSQKLKYWVRMGGPIDPEWAAETRWLKRELHRAQCRAVRRIHDDFESSLSRPRCLGALIVWRSQQQQQQQSRTSGPQPHPSPPQQQQYPQKEASTVTTTPAEQPNSTLNGEIIACNSTGKFQHMGPENRDIAFICDFCDGFLIWENLRSMPSTRQRTSTSPASMRENWAATGFTHPHSHAHPNQLNPAAGQDAGIELEDRSRSPGAQTATGQATIARALDTETELELRGEEKTVVFPPVAIANHLPPEPGEWQAPLLCPLCDEYYYEEQGDDDMDRVRYAQDERGFESVAALQEHFEWAHASLLPSLAKVTPKAPSCQVM
ncbi:hypothetical protein F4802DRAFT_594502 [Xylaria palmicola]|nr:hypothetical protein F4802DRAFT_594502 [Xylaria palmicola]